MVVDVALDERIQKALPVQVDWTGKLPARLILVRSIVTPKEVELIGPKAILEDMSTIYTTPVPLNGITQTGKTETKLVIPSTFLSLKSGSKDRVAVENEVVER